MEFVNTKFDVLNKVEFEIPQSSKCGLLSKILCDGKIRKNVIKSLIQK